MAFVTSSPTSSSLATTFQHVIRQATPTVTSAPTTTTPIYFLTEQYVTITGFTSPHVTIPDKTITMVLPTCIQTIEPDPNGYLPAGTCHAIWNYYPTFNGSLIFLVLFALLTTVHIYQSMAYRKKFCWVVIMASLWETLAFIFRSVSARYQMNAGIYIVYQIFVLLSPLWVNTFAHMVFARMVHYFTPSRKVLSISALAFETIFVSFNVAAAIVQIVGVAMASPLALPEEKSRAMNIYMSGISLQLAFIFIFIVFAVKFHFDMSRSNTPSNVYMKTSPTKLVSRRSSWFALLLVVYIASACLIVRIIFRLAELPSVVSDISKPVVASESYFYALEAVPMLIAILAFNVVHPGVVLVGEDADMPGIFATCIAIIRRRRGQKELTQSSEKDEVPW